MSIGNSPTRESARALPGNALLGRYAPDQGETRGLVDLGHPSSVEAEWEGSLGADFDTRHSGYDLVNRPVALRHARPGALRAHSPRRIVLGLLMYAVGVAFERLGLDAVASFAFVSACLAVPVLTVACAVWWVLRGPRSAYVR